MKLHKTVRFTTLGEILEFSLNFILIKVLKFIDGFNGGVVLSLFPEEDLAEEAFPDYYFFMGVRGLIKPLISYKELRSGLLMKIHNKETNKISTNWGRPSTFFSPRKYWVPTMTDSGH